MMHIYPISSWVCGWPIRRLVATQRCLVCMLISMVGMGGGRKSGGGCGNDVGYILHAFETCS